MIALFSILVILIFFSGFLSGSETALFSLSPLTLKSYKTSPEKKFQKVAFLMERPRDVLVTILILNVLSNLLIQNTVSSIFDEFNDWTLKVGLPLILVLIFGEVLPKSIALPYNVGISMRIAPLIAWVNHILKYIREPMTKATSSISRFIFFFLRKEKEFSVDELRHVIKSSRESGVLLHQECDLIEGALDLQHFIVKEQMRPREEILYYDIRSPLLKLKHLLVDLETTRIPVCEGDLEKILGILSAKQFFFHRDQIKKGEDLLPILKKPYFVPEAMKAWVLLKNLRERKESLSIVLDEYGSISGLITQEDLIETVVGEITDRRDTKSLYTRSSDDIIIASGKLELSEFKEIFGIPLQSHENIVTLGGWLTEQLGDIPATGIKYATDQFLFYVLAADPNRIRRVYVRRLKPPKKK